MVNFEKRMSKNGPNPIEKHTMRTICTILYNKFDFQVKIDVDRGPPTVLNGVDGQPLLDVNDQPRTIACRVDFENMKNIVERQR